MSEFEVKISSLSLSQGLESLANDLRAGFIEDEPEESKRYKISPRATLDALSWLRISGERIIIPKTLGVKARGASASVQLAILLPPKDEHSGHRSAQGHFVALKQFRLDDDKGDKAGLAPLAHELSILRNLKHKNIVRGLGFVENVAQGIAWIVLPWAAKGNLKDYVRWTSASKNWSRVKLIGDIVCGLDYLHGQSEPICHGDLKSPNILINEQGTAIITDFGSARILREGCQEARSKTARRGYSTTSSPPEGPRVEFSESTGSITMTAPGYTVRWAAPEVLDGELPTLASDIWSLGWICWEVLTGKLPFDDISNDKDVIIEVMGGELPGLHESLARNTDTRNFSTRCDVISLCKLMETCWAMAPHSRPKSRDLIHVQRLASLIHAYRPSLPVYDSHWSEDLLQAVGERHIVEGRLGEALQYIQEYRRYAQPTGRDPATITFQKMLDQCRRSTSGVETVSEEEAAKSWNLALNFFAGQLYLEAERHVIDAALLYEVLGFDKQVLECVQFLDVIQDEAASTSPRNPTEAARYNKGLPRRLLTRPEKLRGPMPTFKDPEDELKKKQVEIPAGDGIRGALQHASPTPLSAEGIVSLVEKYHAGKIRQWGESSGVFGKLESGIEFIECILASSEAFERVSCFWRLDSLACLPPFPQTNVKLFDGYFTPLGSEKFQVSRLDEDFISAQELEDP
ncbi:hypothetical protein FRC04_007983 [Tulasnella sp. 424]|nr:hypothetical protein FRC04_007983 [Tulasnella sp. 424]